MVLVALCNVSICCKCWVVKCRLTYMEKSFHTGNTIQIINCISVFCIMKVHICHYDYIQDMSFFQANNAKNISISYYCKEPRIKLVISKSHKFWLGFFFKLYHICFKEVSLLGYINAIHLSVMHKSLIYFTKAYYRYLL